MRDFCYIPLSFFNAPSMPFSRVFEVLRALPARFLSWLLGRPTVSFVLLLALLLGTIALGAYLRTPEAGEPIRTLEPKETQVFTIGKDTAYLSVPAKTRKETVVNVVALTPGIVTNIFVTEGQAVESGRVLLALTNDFGGGNTALQKQIARNSDALVRETYTLEKRINELEAKQAKRDPEKNDLAESIELKKLKVARAALRTNRDNSALSVALAESSDAVLRPRTFSAATVERIFVKEGDYVSPGTILASLRSKVGATTLEALVSPETARLFDPEKEALLTTEGETSTVGILPTYFSRQETERGLFSIRFTLSPTLGKEVTDSQYETLRLPLSSLEPSTTLVPIDSLFQNNDRAWVLLIEGERALLHEVSLGRLYGSFAEITSPLPATAKLILNRSILPGEPVAITD